MLLVLDCIMAPNTSSLLVYFLFPFVLNCSSEERRLYTFTDFLLFDSNELIYFEVLTPDSLRYIFKIRPARDFGSTFADFRFNRVNLVAADPPHGCQPLVNHLQVRDAIVLVERGSCSFLSKSKIAEAAGALAIFIADHDLENAQAMVDMVQDGTGRLVNIPAGFLLGSDGYHIRRGIQQSATLRAVISIPVNVTSNPDLYTRQPPWSYW